jgi:hypothetical protein
MHNIVYNIYITFLYIHIVICVPSLIEIAQSVPELCWNIYIYIYIHFYLYIYIYRYNIYIRFLYIHIVICVPSLVEIARGVPELCCNIHTHTYVHTHMFMYIDVHVLKLRYLSPWAKYTDRAPAACQRSYCQRLRIEGFEWSIQRIPTAVFSAL